MQHLILLYCAPNNPSNTSFPLPDDTTVLFLNAVGTHGSVTPHVKSFLQYVHEHIVTDAFTDEINTEILKIKCDEKIRGEFMHFELLLHDKKEEGRREGRQ